LILNHVQKHVDIHYELTQIFRIIFPRYLLPQIVSSQATSPIYELQRTPGSGTLISPERF
jgi:hypothetical protein